MREDRRDFRLREQHRQPPLILGMQDREQRRLPIQHPPVVKLQPRLTRPQRVAAPRESRRATNERAAGYFRLSTRSSCVSEIFFRMADNVLTS